MAQQPAAIDQVLAQDLSTPGELGHQLSNHSHNLGHHPAHPQLIVWFTPSLMDSNVSSPSKSKYFSTHNLKLPDSATHAVSPRAHPAAAHDQQVCVFLGLSIECASPCVFYKVLSFRHISSTHFRLYLVTKGKQENAAASCCY